MRVENTIPGRVYEFSEEVNISRPGAEIRLEVGREIIRMISPENAFRLAQKGNDVYTPEKVDAYRLAVRITRKNLRVVEHPAHQAAYFPHWKGILQDGTEVHVFFGGRGQNLKPRA